MLVIIGTIIGSALGTWLGVKFTIKADPNATGPEIHIVLPETDGGDSELNTFLGVQAVNREKTGVNKLLSVRARMWAVDGLVKENGLTRSEARRRVNAIPESAIAQAVKEAGVPVEVYGDFGDGTLLKKIIDWLGDPANQAKLKAIIETIMRLALLFANADNPAMHVIALKHWTAAPDGCGAMDGVFILAG